MQVWLVQPDDELKSFVLRFVESVLENEELPLNETERARLSDDLLEETVNGGRKVRRLAAE